MVRNLLFVLLLSMALILSACAKKEAVPVIEEVEPVEEVAPPLEEVEAEPVEPVVEEVAPLVLEDVFFDYDKYNIKKEYKAILTKNAELLLGRPKAKLLIEGHCDERGTNEYNLALGEKRAKAVLDFYVTYGIDAGRLSMVSYGEERPFARGGNEEAWAKNRRAHMVIQ